MEKKIILTTFYYYLISYFLVTIIASFYLLFNWMVLKQGVFDNSLGLQANATQFESFQTTKPFHPVYNIFIFPFFGIGMF